MSQCPFAAPTDPKTFTSGMPTQSYHWLREQGAVVWQEDPIMGEGYWAVSQQAELDYISKNPALFSSAEKSCFYQKLTEDDLAAMQMLMINMDPPDHLKFRRIVRAAFTPKAVEAYHRQFREIMTSIIDKVAEQGQCEFVKDVAAELPLIAICEILGIPTEDRAQFFEWTNTMIGTDDPELATSPEAGMMAQIELWTYVDKILERHAKQPLGHIVGTLLDGTVDGDKLSHDEFRSFVMLLLVAGNETTRTATSQGMRLLIEHPEQFQLLIENPALIPDAIEEILRVNAPIVMFQRTAMQDIDLGGASVKQGDKLVLMYQSASHDESFFEQPEVFDITRSQREDVRNHHRAFGIGEHFCLGSHLARLELQITFEEIVKRLRNPQFAGDVRYLQSNLVNGIKEMQITFDLA